MARQGAGHQRFPALIPEIDSDVMEAVSTALYENRWLSVTYRNAKAVYERQDDVMPLGLAQWTATVSGGCRFRGDTTTNGFWRCTVSVSAAATAFTFTRPADFDLAKYNEEGHFGVGDGVRIRLRFHLTESMRLLHSGIPLSEDQTCEEHETHYVFTAHRRRFRQAATLAPTASAGCLER